MPIPANQLSIGPYRLLTGGTIRVEQVLDGDVVIKDEHGKRARLRAANVARLVLPREG